MSGAGRDESSAFIRTKDGQRKFIGGGAMARLNAKRQKKTVTARGNRLLNPLEREQARQTIPGVLPPFERFFAGLLRSEARDFLEANRKGGTETWKTICQRLSLPVPNGPLPPYYNGQRDHFAYRAALVMEEARFSVAEGVRSLEKWLHGSAKRKHPSSSPSTRTSNSNAAILGLSITGIQYKEKTGHSTLTFTKKKELTRDELQSLRHGTVFSLCNQARQSTVDNTLLACVLPQSREEIVQLKSFSVMVFRKASISTTGLWDVVPIASLLTEQRTFEACQNFFTGFKSIPFLFPLLGGKGPSHLRFQEDDAGEIYAVQADNGHQSHLEDEKQKRKSSKSLQEIFRVPPLNETQEKAARSFLGAEEDTITLVQGPPGTGKTTLLLAVICRYVALHFPQKRRLMVCAPTNKAVSVLCERFLGSMKTENPPCNVVLVGDEDKLLLEGSNNRSTASELRSIFLYSFVHTILDDMKFMKRTLMRSGTRHRGLVPTGRRLVYRLKQNVSDKQVINGTAEVLQNLEDCSSGRSGTSHSSKEVIDKVDVLMIAIGEWKRENIWQEVLRRADVIFCTLASAGTNILRKSATSDMDDLIIDEAAACTESLMAVAFNFLPRRLLAVGDPKQLPATVASPLAEELGLSKSLHERLMYECDYPHVMLDVQYRMKPEISSFPSRQFYGGKLADAPNVTRPDYSSGVHGITSGSDSRQYTFLDVQGTEAQNHSGSYQNEAEAHAIASVIRNIGRSRMSGDLTSAYRLRVITFYAAQVALIKRILYRENLGSIQVATVDSSQGCEADFVIVSFVRGQGANGRSRIGFLSDVRRLNVSLTRAKFHLVCVGNVQQLANMTDGKSETAKRLAMDAIRRQCVVAFSPAVSRNKVSRWGPVLTFDTADQKRPFEEVQNNVRGSLKESMKREKSFSLGEDGTDEPQKRRAIDSSPALAQTRSDGLSTSITNTSSGGGKSSTSERSSSSSSSSASSSSSCSYTISTGGEEATKLQQASARTAMKEAPQVIVLSSSSDTSDEEGDVIEL